MSDATRLLEILENVRKVQGEEAYQAAVKQVVREAYKAGGGAKAVILDLFKDKPFLDFAVLEKEALEETRGGVEGGLYSKALMELLSKQLPGLKTQAQFNAFVVSFDAFRGVITEILAQNPENEVLAKKLLDQGFEVLRQATKITEVLEKNPEAATNGVAEDFKRGPMTPLDEYELQRKILSELPGLKSTRDLNDWYTTNRKRLDRVTTPELRDAMIDAIRAHKTCLGKDSN